ncbi:MAG: hypothetical protein CVU79_04535, partial [Elusimicrobia bacterium HGW-Elusimicrobia-3]
SDGSGKVAISAVTNTELGYLSGVTSALQTQLDAKAALGGATFTGAVNLTDVALNVTGANGNIVSASSITTSGGMFAGEMTVTNAVTAASGTFTAVGDAQYSVETSSGIKMNAGILSVTGLSAFPNNGVASVNDASALAVDRTFMKLVGNNAGATATLTSIIAGVAGQMVILEGTSDTDSITIPAGINVKLAGAIPPEAAVLGASDTIMLIFDGSNWVEVSRSDNG